MIAIVPHAESVRRSHWSGIDALRKVSADWLLPQLALMSLSGQSVDQQQGSEAATHLYVKPLRPPAESSPRDR
jgi:hypothetical protein